MRQQGKIYLDEKRIVKKYTVIHQILSNESLFKCQDMIKNNVLVSANSV